MAIRNIITDEDPFLHKKCRPVVKFDKRLWTLLDDMADTLREENGVGLAAIQVGVLRRAVIIDVGDGNGVRELINPVILEKSGEQEPMEGCLSIPGKWGSQSAPSTLKFARRTATESFSNMRGRTFWRRLPAMKSTIWTEFYS